MKRLLAWGLAALLLSALVYGGTHVALADILVDGKVYLDGGKRTTYLGWDGSQVVIVDEGTEVVDSDELATSVSGLTATSTEINRAADVSARLVSAGDTLAVTAASHDGKTILLDQADGSEVTLPAATGSGATFRFVVSTAISSSAHLIQTTGETEDFVGVIYQVDTDTSDTVAAYPALVADDFDVITLDGTDGAADVGDWIEVIDIATGQWAVHGDVNGTGTVGTVFSDSV
jgi:hypothetical protein